MSSHGSHRSKLLHSMLGKKVKLTFQDGSEAEGILKYSDAWKAPDWISSGKYYLTVMRDGFSKELISFRKTSVKKVEEL